MGKGKAGPGGLGGNQKRRKGRRCAGQSLVPSGACPRASFPSHSLHCGLGVVAPMGLRVNLNIG